jgi:hypothetical protein
MSEVDLANLGSYEECLESLKHAEDDTKRVAIMNYLISHLKNQLAKVKEQLTDSKKATSKEKEDLEGKLQKEKNLR